MGSGGGLGFSCLASSGSDVSSMGGGGGGVGGDCCDCTRRGLLPLLPHGKPGSKACLERALTENHLFLFGTIPEFARKRQTLEDIFV